jgi:hypothetical protein
MQKIIFAFIAAGFIISCNPKQEQPQAVKNSGSTAVDTVAIMNDPKNNLNIQTGSFTEIDSSGILMFPLTMGEAGRDKGSFSYKDMPAASGYWNIIFYNAKTGAYHLLGEQKMLISSFEPRYSSGGNIPVMPSLAKYIFYQVITTDYNNDKLLNSDDPQYLFISDKEGNNFRQLSPAGCNLRSWNFIKSANKVLITATKDSDNNKKFDEKDELLVFQVDMEKETSATEIFPQEFTNKLKLMYDKDWKRVNE